jgi:hypothetical protein
MKNIPSQRKQPMSNHPVLEPSPPETRAVLPLAGELAFLFREFMSNWAGIQVHAQEGEANLPLGDPVEMTVRWGGTRKGTLALRVPASFLEKWAGLPQSGRGHFPEADSFLKEGASLFALYLIQSLWMVDLFELGPLLARRSLPTDLPEGEPQAFCALETAGEPVELRLWMAAGD